MFRRSTLSLILVIALMSASGIAPASGAAAVRDKWALLIGVDTFQDPAVQPNKSNASNAMHLANALKDPSSGRFPADHVTVITGNRATKSGIEKTISDWLLKRALPDDLILLYISSASVTGPNGEPMLFTFDTLGSEPELSALNFKQLAADLRKRIQSKNIVLVVDSSPATKNAPDFASISELGISVLSATSGNQRSQNNGATNTSVFAHRFADAIKANAGNNTLQQIFEIVASTVSADAQQCFSAKQTPTLALATTNPGAAELALGSAPKNVKPGGLAFGHPLNDLALTRPDLLAPKPAGNKPAATNAKPSQPKPADDDEDEDDDKPRPDVDFGSYMTKMKQDIQKNWKPPKGLESRRLVAVFTIMRDGRITSPTIVEGSGIPALDKSAMDALQAASPLDPLPPGSPRSVDIKYKFDWNVRRE